MARRAWRADRPWRWSMCGRKAGKGGSGRASMAIVAEGDRGRAYLPPDDAHRHAADVERPESAPEASLPAEALGFRVQNYGLTRWADLFTNRQLLALTTFSDLVMEARERVLATPSRPAQPLAIALEVRRHRRRGLRRRRGDLSGHVLIEDGRSWLVDRDLVLGPRSQPRNTFSRQAIPMTWDFVEVNPVRRAEPVAGGERFLGRWRRSTVWRHSDRREHRLQADASELDYDGASHLDRPALLRQHRLLRPLGFLLRLAAPVAAPRVPRSAQHDAGPKAEELVANPYRHDGKDGAKEFFEDGFRRVFARARESALADYPITVYYAFKQSDARRRWHRVDWLGDAARRDDPLGLGDHGDVADAQRACPIGCWVRARTPSPHRSSSRCDRVPTTRRRLIAVV